VHEDDVLFRPAAAGPTPAEHPSGAGLGQHETEENLELLVRNCVLQVGQYLVGEAHDPQLSGHPSIRY
jgi:hypothetical protein